MRVYPVLLTDGIKKELQKSLDRGNNTWEQIEGWLADRVACVWEINAQAWAVTFANADDEIELVLGGGQGAFQCVPPFAEAMLALPEHRGKTLRLEGRKGWRRFLVDWDCEEVGGGNVILTKRV